MNLIYDSIILVSYMQLHFFPRVYSSNQAFNGSEWLKVITFQVSKNLLKFQTQKDKTCIHISLRISIFTFKMTNVQGHPPALNIDYTPLYSSKKPPI